MDSFVNLAKQGYDAYSKNQSDVSKTGGQELNSPHHSQSASGSPEFDHDEVVKNANAHGSGDSSLFSKALSFLNDNKSEHTAPIQEAEATKAHKTAYDQDAAGSMDARSIGSAAALQVLKQFTSGKGDGGSSSGSSNTQTNLISLAMAEASKLFDKSGGAASGNKQDAVNGAAMTVMKLFIQSKTGGVATTGGSNSGGLGELFKMAQSFAK